MLGFVGSWGCQCALLSSRVVGSVVRAPQCSRQLKWSASIHVDREVIVKTARLAQLELSDDEIDKLIPEFQRMIGFVDQLGELDVEGVEPMSRVEDTTNVLREDVPVSFPSV
jgi:aspartyl/glutamyl-tRNA(Asn/Gln) amidotransferase C subunit